MQFIGYQTSIMIGKARPKLPWLDGKLRDLIKLKHSAWKACKRFPSPSNNTAFRTIRNQVTSALRSAEKRYLQSLHRDMRLANRCNSAKGFWSYVKQITGKIKASAVPDLEVPQDNGSVTVTSDAEKASALNQHFAKQSRLENCPVSFPDLPSPSELSPDSFLTTPAEVFDVLSDLKSGKVPGLDELPPKLLRLCARGISGSLCTLFNRSFSEGCMPSAWKEALVVPVYKAGPRSCPSNYRPIALLSIVSKAMEKIVLKKLSAFLWPLLTPKQSGFRHGDGMAVPSVMIVRLGADVVGSSPAARQFFFIIIIIIIIIIMQ